MKVVAFNGSARKDGNTAILLNYALAELRKEGIGRDIGDVEADAEGVQTMKTLGQNMAWLLKKLHT